MALPISPARTPNSNNIFVEVLYYIIFYGEVREWGGVRGCGIIRTSSDRQWVGYEGHAGNFPSLNVLRPLSYSVFKTTVHIPKFE